MLKRDRDKDRDLHGNSTYSVKSYFIVSRHYCMLKPVIFTLVECNIYLEFHKL